VESYVWTWNGIFKAGIYVVSAAVLGLAVVSAVVRKESLRDIGIRLDNLGRALAEAVMLTIIPAASMLAAGMMMGTVRPDWRHTVSHFPYLVFWGFLQQYVLQGFVHRRLNLVVGNRVAQELLTAAFFALCHLPNWRLMLGTFAGGWMWAFLYRRNPNLFALAVSHAIGSAALSIAFGPGLLHGMKVGRGYFSFVAPKS